MLTFLLCPWTLSGFNIPNSALVLSKASLVRIPHITRRTEAHQNSFVEFLIKLCALVSIQNIFSRKINKTPFFLGKTFLFMYLWLSNVNYYTLVFINTNKARYLLLYATLTTHIYFTKYAFLMLMAGTEYSIKEH